MAINSSKTIYNLTGFDLRYAIEAMANTSVTGFRIFDEGKVRESSFQPKNISPGDRKGQITISGLWFKVVGSVPIETVITVTFYAHNNLRSTYRAEIVIEN